MFGSGRVQSCARHGARCVRFRCRCWCWRRCRGHRSSGLRTKRPHQSRQARGIDPVGRGARDGRTRFTGHRDGRSRASKLPPRSRRPLGSQSPRRRGRRPTTRPCSCCPCRCWPTRRAPASFNGSYTTSVPIQVPEFRGLEPKLRPGLRFQPGHEGRWLLCRLCRGRLAADRLPGRGARVAEEGRGRARRAPTSSCWTGRSWSTACRWPAHSGAVVPSCAAGGTHATRYRELPQDHLRSGHQPMAGAGSGRDRLGCTATCEPGPWRRRQRPRPPRRDPRRPATRSATPPETSAQPWTARRRPPAVAETEPEESGGARAGGGRPSRRTATIQPWRRCRRTRRRCGPGSSRTTWWCRTSTEPADDPGNVPEMPGAAGEAIAPGRGLGRRWPRRRLRRSEQDLANTRYRWLLTLVRDTNGNQVDYSYGCPSAPVCWPDRRGLQRGQDPIPSNRWHHPDTRHRQRPGQVDQRLAQIDVYVSGVVHRYYAAGREQQDNRPGAADLGQAVRNQRDCTRRAGAVGVAVQIFRPEHLVSIRTRLGRGGPTGWRGERNLCRSERRCPAGCAGRKLVAEQERSR